MDSSGTPANRPDKTGFMYFVVGLIVALIPSGLQLIGVTVNIWLGGTILAIAFVLVIYAFWIWERASKWHLFLRIGTIIIAAVFYFLLIERQMVAEWHREHPIVGVKSQENTPQLNPGSVPTIANQGSSEPPATVPKESGKRSKTSSSGAIVQENNGGSNNTNTQIGTAQGPIAIAPNGIANAAPNLGSQSVTNNFVPPPRTIPPDVRAECLELLSGTHGKVSVNALMGDSEGFNYAKQWYDLFAAAHWEMADDQVGKLMEVGTVTQGIEVRFHGEHVTMPRQPLVVPSFLVPVVNCIEKLGPKPVGNPFPDMPENEIFFLVGNRPN